MVPENRTGVKVLQPIPEAGIREQGIGRVKLWSMTPTMARHVVVVLVSFLLVACVAAARQFVDPRPVPTQEDRLAFGRVGIAVSAPSKPQAPTVPESKSDLEKAGTVVGTTSVGAGVGAAMSVSCGPFFAICVPVFAAVGGATGLVAGVIRIGGYGSPEDVNSASLTIRNTLFSESIEDKLLSHVLARAQTEFNRDLRRVSYEADGWKSDQSAREDGIRTIIVITVPRGGLVELKPGQKRNPDLRLELEVQGKIFTTKSSIPAFEREWLYDSEVHSYFAWAEDDGKLLSSEIDRATKALGDKILADFLGITPKSIRNAASGSPHKVAMPASGALPAGRQEGENDYEVGVILSKAGSLIKGLFDSKPASDR